MVTGNGRWRALVVLVVGAVVAAAWGAPDSTAASAGVAAPADSPNFVVVVLDDARADDIKPRFMPRANRLIADAGARFNRFYAPFPLCCPARASVLTGQYAHNHGVVWNRSPQGFDAFDDDHTLATWLDPTYRTALVGKYLSGYGASDSTYVPPGWDHWQVALEGTIYDYTRFAVNESGTIRDVKQYSTSFYGDQAVGFVDDAVANQQPFFLFLALVAPHSGSPHADDDEPLPSPFVERPYRDSYTGPRLPADPTVNERNVSDKNPGVAQRDLLTKKQLAVVSEMLAQRRESLRSVDDQIARIIKRLKRVGELSDTYVLLLSDNGFMLGEHRVRSNKRYLYEPAVRVPLLMRGPRVPAGSTVTAPTAQIDIAPTLLRLADVPLSPERLGLALDGRSLLPALDNDVTPRPIVLEEHNAVTPDRAGRWVQKGLRTERFVYLRFLRHGNFEELYDLRADPYQEHNVAGDPQYAAALRHVRRTWVSFRDCAGAQCRRQLRE